MLNCWWITWPVGFKRSIPALKRYVVPCNAVQFDRPYYTKMPVNNKFPCRSVFMWSVLRTRASTSVSQRPTNRLLQPSAVSHHPAFPECSLNVDLSPLRTNKPKEALQRARMLGHQVQVRGGLYYCVLIFSVLMKREVLFVNWPFWIQGWRLYPAGGSSQFVFGLVRWMQPTFNL